MMKKQNKRNYEYHKAFTKQSPEIQKMLSAGEKPGRGVVKALTVKKKKPKAVVKKKKKLTIFQKTKKRLKKVFGKGGY